jgi:hypothetical protein
MFKIMSTVAEINKAISSIKGRGAKLDGDIHRAGVSVLAHATKHGDTTLADNLVHAMPKGGRKLALVEWILAFGQVAKLDPKADKAAIAEGRLFKLDRERKYDEAGAIGTPWTEFKPEAAVHTAFDVQAAVQSVLRRMKSAAETGLSIEHKAEALKDAEALVILLRGVGGNTPALPALPAVPALEA